MDIRNIPINLYQILGLKDFVSIPMVRAAYKKLALRHHPDREGGDAGKMQMVNTAYGFIVRNKGEYDKFLNERKYGRAVPRVEYRFVINPGWDNVWQGSSDVWTGRVDTSSAGY